MLLERADSFTERQGDEEREARRLLVERIISSRSFAKCERLISFLQCVCDLALTGEYDSINEQYIGITVFERRPDYDPGVDGIVRSHASRLRHRLERYFAEEGMDEELLLTIPKGGYIPLFLPREGIVGPAPVATPSWTPLLASVEELPIPYSPPTAAPIGLPQDQAGRVIRRLTVALVLTALLALGALAALWEQRRPPVRTESNRLFWGRLFNGERTVVVGADSGLVILQGLTKRRITLSDYVNGDYLKNLPGTVYSAQQTADLAQRRYTSIVDLRIQNQIFHLPGAQLDHTQFRYARDLRPQELKQGNAILLGTYESTPWVQLYEPAMNFYFQNDLAGGVFSIVNRAPRPGEQPLYSSVNGDTQHTIYGVAAFRPSLSGSGNVLILEGQSMAGTETASDFVFDDGYLLPFLRSIQRPDGSIPYFELVLRSRSLSGEASRLEMVASRVDKP